MIRHQKEDKYSIQGGSLSQNIQHSTNVKQYQKFMEIKRKVLTKLAKVHQVHLNQTQVGKQSNLKVYVMLISSKYDNPYQQFRKFLVSASDSLPAEFRFFYSSKKKYKGIIDTQLFFPSFFEISYNTFLLTQHLPQSQSLPGLPRQGQLQGSQLQGSLQQSISNLQSELQASSQTTVATINDSFRGRPGSARTRCAPHPPTHSPAHPHPPLLSCERCVFGQLRPRGLTFQ